jgi:hypothetical protein
MKKIKLLFLTLFAFIGLSASSQVLTSFNVDVINLGGCQYTLFGDYYGSGVQGSIIFTPQPNGGYAAVVPGIDSLNVNICAEAASPCTTVCITETLYIGPGQGVQAFTLLLQSNDSDFDGYTDDADCAPFDPYIYPNATELCDGIDNNCDGVIEVEPSISMYFVPDSIVTELNSIFIVCQTTNVTSWEWNFGNGAVSNSPYPTTNYDVEVPYTVCLYGTSYDGCVVDSCLVFTIDSLGWAPGGVMTNYTLNIVPEYTVGVDEIKTNNIKTWPNPISDMLNVTTPSNQGNISIMSIDGRCVYQNKYTSGLVRIDSSDFGQGSYVIVINDSTGKLYTTKIVK